MVTITDAAKEELGRILDSRAPGIDKCLRLAVSPMWHGPGEFGIVIDAKGACVEARVVVTGVLPKPVRVGEIEAALLGRPVDRFDLPSLSELAADRVATQSDELASSTYRTQLIRVMTPKAIANAVQRAG